jgi:hypothetical protein
MSFMSASPAAGLFLENDGPAVPPPKSEAALSAQIIGVQPKI